MSNICLATTMLPSAKERLVLPTPCVCVCVVFLLSLTHTLMHTHTRADTHRLTHSLSHSLSYMALWTGKVLCGSFLCAIYKFSFIHMHHTVSRLTVTLSLHLTVKSYFEQDVATGLYGSRITVSKLLILTTSCPFLTFWLMLEFITDEADFSWNVILKRAVCKQKIY